MTKTRPLFPALIIALLALLLAIPALAEDVPGETNLLVPNGERQIPVSIVLPEGDGPFPLVVINHGHGGSRQENGGFSGIAQALRNAGIASIRMDFPGCGESEAPFMDNCLTNMIDDSDTCLLYMLENYSIDESKLGILGYSMGGRIALSIASGEDNPYRAIGLLAPATFAYDTEEARANYQVALDEGVYLQPWYGRDLTISAKWFEDLFETDAVMANLQPLEHALVVYGDADATVPPESCLACAEQIGAQIVEVAGADHGYGFYSDQPEVTEQVEGAFVSFYTSVFNPAD